MQGRNSELVFLGAGDGDGVLIEDLAFEEGLLEAEGLEICLAGKLTIWIVELVVELSG